jgi:hypothetical protein
MSELEKIKAMYRLRELSNEEMIDEAAYWRDWATFMEVSYEKEKRFANLYERLIDLYDVVFEKSKEIYYRDMTESERNKIEAIKEALKSGRKQERTERAKLAANTRHSKPGGSRDKRAQIRAIWATGKYSSRDRCAEEECAGLDMSFSAARKALRNTPDPDIA